MQMYNITTEELPDRKSYGLGLETENTAMGIRRADYTIALHSQKLAIISLTSGGRSVGIVRSRTQATQFSFTISAVENKINKVNHLRFILLHI
jgi:hypothetical protein